LTDFLKALANELLGDRRGIYDIGVGVSVHANCESVIR
jgi:hypothetical protein